MKWRTEIDISCSAKASEASACDSTPLLLLVLLLCVFRDEPVWAYGRLPTHATDLRHGRVSCSARPGLSSVLLSLSVLHTLSRCLCLSFILCPTVSLSLLLLCLVVTCVDLTLWRPLLPYGYSYAHRDERQSAQMSKITNDSTGCFIAVSIWQQWSLSGVCAVSVLTAIQWRESWWVPSLWTLGSWSTSAASGMGGRRR